MLLLGCCSIDFDNCYIQFQLVYPREFMKKKQKIYSKLKSLKYRSYYNHLKSWLENFKITKPKSSVINEFHEKNFFNIFHENFFFREIAFLAVLNFFPVKKFIFGHFWNSKKNGIWSKKFREIDLFNFTSFFPCTFLTFLAHVRFSQFYWHFEILKRKTGY